MRCFFWLLYVVVNCFLLCVYVPLLVLVVLFVVLVLFGMRSSLFLYVVAFVVDCMGLLLVGCCLL